jgi:hypothetical protein
MQQAKRQSQLRMITYLKEQVDEDAISNDWEREFICDLARRKGYSLTDKQDEVLTRLFERY